MQRYEKILYNAEIFFLFSWLKNYKKEVFFQAFAIKRSARDRCHGRYEDERDADASKTINLLFFLKKVKESGLSILPPHSFQ